MKLKSLARSAISFLIAGFFLYFAFRGTNAADLWQALRTVKYGWVIALIPVVILSHWLRALRWAHLLAPIKSDLSSRNLFSAVMIGYAVNNILPRVGEFVRPLVIGKLEKIPKSSALATVVVERIIDFISFYFIVCIVLFLYPHSLDPFVTNVEAARPWFLVASLLACVAFTVVFFKAEALFKFLAKLKRFAPASQQERLDRIIDSFLSGFRVVQMKDRLGAIVVYSLLIWALYAVGMYVPFFAFDSLAKFNLDFGASVVLLTITSIAWVLPAPGAMGTYHSFLTVALVKLYGVDSATALGFSIITHETGYLIVMIIGGYYFFKDHFRVSDVTTDSDTILPKQV
ncbi:MAG: lysylphosphatidylglycerol synthase transmembrane domain-containing protein [Bacteroidota bacterium]